MPASFRPSRHGFRFANRFGVPLVAPLLRAAGLPATGGLCGGMVQAARAAFLDGTPVPARETPPAVGTPLFRRLFRRQVATFGPPPFFPDVWRFARWTRCTDAALARRTRPEHERAQRLLEKGRLVRLGLVYVRSVARLWENHQVLAYAVGEEGVLRIYDPNEPCRDDVTLAASAMGAPAFEKRRAGQAVRPVRGFFVMDP